MPSLPLLTVSVLTRLILVPRLGPQVPSTWWGKATADRLTLRQHCCTGSTFQSGVGCNQIPCTTPARHFSRVRLERYQSVTMLLLASLDKCYDRVSGICIAQHPIHTRSRCLCEIAHEVMDCNTAYAQPLGPGVILPPFVCFCVPCWTSRARSLRWNGRPASQSGGRLLG